MGHNISNLSVLAPIYKVMSYDSDIKLSHFDSHNRVPIISPAIKPVSCHPDQILMEKSLVQIPLPVTAYRKSAHLCVRNEKFLQSCPLPTSLWQSLIHLADNNGLNLQLKSTCFLFPDVRCFSNRSTWKLGSISPPLACQRKCTRPKLPAAAISGSWGDRRVSRESEGHHLKPRGKTLKCHTPAPRHNPPEGDIALDHFPQCTTGHSMVLYVRESRLGNVMWEKLVWIQIMLCC